MTAADAAAAAVKVAIVSLPVEAWDAVLLQIQWESDPALRQATAVIRNAIAESGAGR